MSEDRALALDTGRVRNTRGYLNDIHCRIHSAVSYLTTDDITVTGYRALPYSEIRSKSAIPQRRQLQDLCAFFSILARM